MTNIPSKQALFALARIISGQPGPYRCPSCARLEWPIRIGHSRQGLWGTRRFGRTTLVKSSSSEPGLGSSFLDFQLSGRQTSESLRQNNESLKSQFLENVRQVEMGLDVSALRIEELEDKLLDMGNPENGVEEPQHELQPWYIRDEGEISEDEYAAIESLLNSENPESTETSQPPEPAPTPDRETEPATEVPEQQPSELLPWYLREQENDTDLVPKIDIHQTEPETYPNIPYDSPPLLQPLVSRLFYDHHLQNIVLLDLRNRDPPPVWGSNTIMILATVRSEGQLAGVAEATSKWLKATAGVQPRVDGLPKKESIIIKRRRLRRKSLRKPGYLIAAPRPTTWVSMYTGYQGMVLQLFTKEGREEYDLEGLWGDRRVVDAGVLDMKPRKMRPGGIEEDERVETRVSQKKNQKKPMWQRELEKRQKKQDKAKEARASKKRWTKEEKEAAKQRRAQAASLLGQAEVSPRRRSFGDRRKGGDIQQTRQLHTKITNSRFRYCASPQTRSVHVSTNSKNEPSSQIRWKRPTDPSRPQKQAAWWGISYDMLPNLSDTILPSSVYDQLLDALRGLPPFAPRDAAMDRVAHTIAVQGDRRVAEKLKHLSASNDSGSLLLLAHFGNLSRFIKSSGSVDISQEYASTFTMDPFPEKGLQWAFDFFLRDMPVQPNAHHWRLAILYYLNLQMYDHKQYPIQRLRDILLLPVSQGISIPLSNFHVILNHIALSSPENRNFEEEMKNEYIFHKCVQGRLAAMDLFLRCMKSQFGYDYSRDEEVYLALYKACCQPYPTLPQLIDDINLPLRKHHNDYRRILIKQYFQKSLPISPELFVLELLQFAHMRKWRSFLKRWNWARDAGVGKDADMWSLFWVLLARGADQASIRMALRYNYHEMLDEGSHLVFNKSTAIGLTKCLDIVDPNGVEFVKHRSVAEGLSKSFE